jgi:hypothetical protein
VAGALGTSNGYRRLARWPLPIAGGAITERWAREASFRARHAREGAHNSAKLGILAVS